MFKKGDKVRCNMPKSGTQFLGVVVSAFKPKRNNVAPRCVVLVKKIISPGKNTFIRSGKQVHVDNKWVKRL